MENRRRHYRHQFAPSARLKVHLKALDSAESIETTAVNLSIGGVCVESPDLAISKSDRWLALIPLQEDAAPFRITVERVHTLQEQGVGFGLRFLPPSNLLIRDEQERTIWRFLLEQQMSDRRRLLDAKSQAG